MHYDQHQKKRKLFHILRRRNTYHWRLNTSQNSRTQPKKSKLPLHGINRSLAHIRFMGIIHAVNLSSTRTCAFFAQVVLYRDLEYDTTRHVTVDDGIDERLVRHARGLRHFLDAI